MPKGMSVSPVRLFLCAVSLFLALGTTACNMMPSLNGDNVQLVIVTPGNPSVAVGDNQQFVANISLSSGETMTTSAVIWTSSNPQVAKINTNGTVTALHAGIATITASSGSTTGTTTLTVSATPVPALVSGTGTRLDVTFASTSHHYAYAINPWEDSVWSYDEGSLNDPDAARLQEIIPLELVSRPSWLAFDANGYYLYIANRQTFDVTAFYVDPVTGRFTMVPGSPFPVEREPQAISVDPAGNFLEVTLFHIKNPVRFRIDPPSGALTPDR